jgi:hypothetical protein
MTCGYRPIRSTRANLKPRGAPIPGTAVSDRTLLPFALLQGIGQGSQSGGQPPWRRYRKSRHASLSPLVVDLQAAGRIARCPHYHLPVALSCNGKAFPRRFDPPTIDHECEINDVSPPIRVVCTLIGVGKELLRDTRRLVQARHVRAAQVLHPDRDSAFEDDLELDRLSIHPERRPDAIAVCANLAQEVDRPARDPAQGPLRYLAAQCPLAVLVRAKGLYIL